jgi:hypothetical protein
MVTTKIKTLAALREKLAHLEHTAEIELRQELSELHEKYGFADVKSFLKAIKAAVSGHPSSGRSRTAKAAAVAKTRKRAKITDAIRAKVKELVKAGKSGTQIAKAVGISLPSVQNVKKALGLVKSRKPEPKKAPAKKKTPVGRKPAKKMTAKKQTTKKILAESPSTPAALQPPASDASAG